MTPEQKIYAGAVVAAIVAGLLISFFFGVFDARAYSRNDESEPVEDLAPAELPTVVETQPLPTITPEYEPLGTATFASYFVSPILWWIFAGFTVLIPMLFFRGTNVRSGIVVSAVICGLMFTLGFIPWAIFCIVTIGAGIAFVLHTTICTTYYGR